MNTTPVSSETLHHHVRRMTGRDPHEEHRVATPLELLFDLTFVIAFGLASSQFAHALAEGHYAAALLGFGFASFAICWAWVNFSWFSSAYDTDDWIFRLVTMVQMIGVLVLAIGLPRMFASIEHGEHLDNSVMVLGYVIMRVAMVFQWLRAARQDPARRRACLTYAIAISVAQLGWVVQILIDFSVGASLMLACVLASDRNGGAGDRRTQGWRHALACPSYRRAPQPVRHHRAGRRGRRHARVAVGRGRGAGLDHGRGSGLHRRYRPHLRHVVGLLHAAFSAGYCTPIAIAHSSGATARC